MQMRFIPAEGSGITQAVRAGDLVLIGGLMPVDESGAVIGSSLSSQATFVFDALKRVLAEAGATLADVVKHNVFLTDQANFAKVNETMAKYFSEPFPARAAVGVKELPRGALVEADAVMCLGN
jgi:reactive intermediate/imine deaminase